MKKGEGQIVHLEFMKWEKYCELCGKLSNCFVGTIVQLKYYQPLGKGIKFMVCEKCLKEELSKLHKGDWIAIKSKEN